LGHTILTVLGEARSLRGAVLRAKKKKTKNLKLIWQKIGEKKREG